MRKGFSLIELSIVLVILGLLVGGILAGQSLIRASELRAVSTEYSRWQTAVHAFRDKYFAVPGDFSAATTVWGRLNSNSDCLTNSGAAVSTSGGCDGNGDGIVPWDNSGAVGTAKEMHQFWRHLALAGLIEGAYTGLAGPTLNSAHVLPGTNSPVSKIPNAGWGAAGGGNCGLGATQCFGNLAADYNGYYVYGVATPSGGNTPINPALRPAEAWNIDTKIDDGFPTSGRVRARYTGANQCTTSASITDLTGTYNYAYSSILCTLFFVRAF